MDKIRKTEFTYKEAINFLNEVGKKGSVLGLEAITNLLERLGNPQKKLKFIHVGGTNGKGSTSAYIASILTEAGYKVGRYISPTVLCYCECIQISNLENNKKTTYITEEEVAQHISAIAEIYVQMEIEKKALPTVFEIETVMAFLEFVQYGCDFVVLEVGLGGKTDATNVVETVECSAITSISMDHMQFLGNTLEEIAIMKAGIIKENTPVISYPSSDEVTRILEKECKRKQAPFHLVKREDCIIQSDSLNGICFQYKRKFPYQIQLLGSHQVLNAAVALEVIDVLKKKGYRISPSSIEDGLKKTTWYGRFSVLSKKPYLIVDGAHNEEAAKQLKCSLDEYFPEKKGIFVVGVFKDKEYEKIIKETARKASVIITITPKNERGLPSEQLAEVAKKYCSKVIIQHQIQEGIEKAFSIANEEDYIICYGSLSFLGEIKEYIEKNGS